MHNLNDRIDDTNEYLRGMRAARDGQPCECGCSDDFERGYNTQYTHEKQMTAIGLKQEKKMSIFQ
jgi:hypothetical protein